MDEKEVLIITDKICDGLCEEAMVSLDSYIQRPNLTMDEELLILNLKTIAESVIYYKEITLEYQSIKLNTQKGLLRNSKDLKMNFN